MKQLKYIKLFEAFESIKLTKTLGYIDTKSRVDFINYLKRLCKNSDFPISSLSDDMFQYLPYSKALKVNVKKEQKACTATSMSEFDRSYAIEGEKCEGGRIKRMWGSRQRVVECPHCGGTGIEPEKDDIKIMKFWFSKDGKLINTTGCDGSVKSVDTSHKGLIQGDVITSTERGYTNKLSRIPDLTKVSFRKSSRSESIPGIFYAYDSDNFFIIQDSYDGGTPPGSDWRRYGRFSWNISGGDFYTITIMSKIDKEEEDEEGVTNPLLYNYPIIWNWRGINLEKWKNVETEIKDAHFALVLNLDKIKHGDYKTVTRIQDERTELKSGSKLDPKQSDESIRKENINRYLKKIAEKADLAADITNVKSVTNRIISGPLALFVVTKHGTNFEGILSRIINRYVDLMRCKEDDLSLIHI